ncbi:transcription factor WhiB [Streptomyces sp. NPDC060223]|uniref:transcription factor WhiB n=1 Tax=unclassified Streptomyces TaxID=2593676 RepID=UPI003633B2F9
MTGPWIGGLAVRRMEPGQTAIADFLCTACGTHRRVAGRAKVADFVRSNPIADHRANCPANKAT